MAQLTRSDRFNRVYTIGKVSNPGAMMSQPLPSRSKIGI
jgi:hypothetical protein